MNALEINSIIEDIKSAVGGYDILGVEYIEPGPGYCGSFEIYVAEDEDPAMVCDELLGVCKDRSLAIDDWHSGDNGFVIQLNAYWDMLND